MNLHFIHRILLIVCTLFMLMPLHISRANEESSKIINSVLKITINSSINPATLNYIESGLNRAKEEKVDAILLTLNTPGGLVTTTKDILGLFGSSDIPVIIWITPEGASATSAGALIASSAHFLYMSNGTNIGAATPIQMSGDLPKNKENKNADEKTEKDGKKADGKKDQEKSIDLGSDLRAKAINDLVALTQSIAETRGRNAALFGKMISEAASYKTLEAKQNNLIDGIANSEQELFQQIDGRTIKIKGKEISFSVPQIPKIIEHEMNIGQKILNILANPSLAYVLFLIGAALIYLEFQTPGGFIAGSLGTLCLLLAGIGFQVLPVNFGAVGLVLLAFILFIVEFYVTTHGILAITGLLALLFGSFFLFKTDDSFLHLPVTLILSCVGGIAIFVLAVTYLVARDFWRMRNKKKSEIFYSHIDKTVTIYQVLEEDLNGYKYRVKLGGEFWNAVSQEKFAEKQKVKVLGEDKEKMILKI